MNKIERDQHRRYARHPLTRIETIVYPAPPDWPNIGLHPSEWRMIKSCGHDMRQYYLIKPIPKVTP